MTPIERIQRIDVAFGRGNVPFILSCPAPDADWAHDMYPNPIDVRLGNRAAFDATGAAQAGWGLTDTACHRQ